MTTNSDREREKYFDWENIFQEVPLIAAELEARADAAYKEELTSLLISDRPAHGTRMHAIRGVMRQWLKDRRDWPLDYILGVSEMLWSYGWREERIAALGVLQFYPPARDQLDFSMLEVWSREVDDWEIVDHLAGLMGRMLEATPRLLGPVRALAISENPWQRRLAIVTLIVASRDPAWEPGLAAMVDRLEHDQHPGVASAVEWARTHLAKAKARRT